MYKILFGHACIGLLRLARNVLRNICNMTLSKHTSLLGIWSLDLLQLRSGAGFPLAAHRSDTVVPFFTTICPLDGWVVMDGGTERDVNLNSSY